MPHQNPWRGQKSSSLSCFYRQQVAEIEREGRMVLTTRKDSASNTELQTTQREPNVVKVGPKVLIDYVRVEP